MSVSSDFGWAALSIVVSALVSGLLGVLISNWYYKRNEARRLKLKILQQLMAYRFDFHSVKFVEAMNQLPVVYHESKEVLTAFKAYYEHVRSNGDMKIGHQRLLELFKTMYKHLNINTEPLNDDIFLYLFFADSIQKKKGV